MSRLGYPRLAALFGSSGYFKSGGSTITFCALFLRYQRLEPWLTSYNPIFTTTRFTGTEAYDITQE